LLVSQPAEQCVADLLVGNLQKRGQGRFGTFYLLVAYAKRNGAGLLRDPILSFRESGGFVMGIVGIDQRNTSVEGLQMLLDSCDEVYVYDGSDVQRTFHPKLYLFEGRNEIAEIVIGSPNLTDGGASVKLRGLDCEV
jgi:HKD family nuclease